jgi:hypothetical protein
VSRPGGSAPPSRSELVDAIAAATSAAVKDLFEAHPHDHFYWCSLITTGEAHAPVLVAWSTEALDAAVSQYPDDPNARWKLEWSYADSPFYCYGEHHFGEVRRLFEELGMIHSDPQGWAAAYDFRLSAMEEAMARVDQSGLFGKGEQRARIVVNVEVMPPDHTNTERALRLNPPEALTVWLEDVAEHE